MNILALNQDWFKTEFEQAGHTVVTCGIRSHMEIRLLHPMLSLEHVLNRCPEGFYPDRIIIFDESAPLYVTGIEESGIPVLFFSVDVQHHFQTHKQLAKNFSKTLFAQRDYQHHFDETGAVARWMPLWATRYYEPSDEKKYPVLFVGTMNRDLNPERVSFFEALENVVPLHIHHGAYWQLFPHAEIVINQTVKGDLNFRVFEAMMSGSVLLTEDGPNGLTELFQPDVHLVTYRKNDVEDAARKINELLADKERARRIGMAGRAEILAKHTAAHRATEILEILENLTPLPDPVMYFRKLINLDWMYRKLREIDTELAMRTLTHGISTIQKGLANLEVMTEEDALIIVFMCIEFDRLNASNLGEEIIIECSKQHSAMSVFYLAFIWKLLNRGESKIAEQLTKALPSDNVQETYRQIDRIITSLLVSGDVATGFH